MAVKILSVLFLLFCPFAMNWAQVKYEKEYRLKPDQVPEQAIQFVASLGFNGAIKWYREEGLIHSTFEAKTRYRRQKYSIEFDSLGALEDVEVKIKWAAVPMSVQAEIAQSLRQQFDRYRLIKIQRQWSGQPEVVVAAVKEGTFRTDLSEKYEIIVKGKSKEGLHWYEFTFSAKGQEISRKRIVLRNTDNLEY